MDIQSDNKNEGKDEEDDVDDTLEDVVRGYEWDTSHPPIFPLRPSI